MSEMIGPLVSKPGFMEAEIDSGAVKNYNRYSKLAVRIEALERKNAELEQEKKVLVENYTALSKNYADIKLVIEKLEKKVNELEREKVLSERVVKKEEEAVPNQKAKLLSVAEITQENDRVLGEPHIIWNPFKIKREEIRNIAFLDNIGRGMDNAWDVSAAGNRSVLAWVEQEDTLYIAGKGGVKANKNCAGMFQNCENLRAIRFGENFDTSDAEDMKAMFYNCRNLTKLDITDFNTSNVTNMRNMFWNCKSLERLELAGFDTSQVVEMYGMFENCAALEELDVSGFDTSNVENIAYMFNGCRNLTDLNVKGFNLSKVKDMAYMFYNCEKLEKLYLTGFGVYRGTNKKNMFWNCRSLKEVETSSFSILQEWDLWKKRLQG